MGAVLTAGLASNLKAAAMSSESGMTVEEAEAFASNPNALIEPTAKAQLPPDTLEALQNALAASIHPVFWVGALMSALGAIAVIFLPAAGVSQKHEIDGERLIMAEQTNINSRNQPVAD